MGTTKSVRIFLYSGTQLLILILSIPFGVHGRVYREYEKFDENSTQEFGIANFDVMLIETDEANDNDKIPESLTSRFGFVFTGLVSTEKELQGVLDYFPVDSKLMLRSRTQDIIWLADALVTRNASQRIHTIWIQLDEYILLHEVIITEIESLGLNLGIYYEVKSKNSQDLKEILAYLKNDPSIHYGKHLFVKYTIHTMLFDFDVFSRLLDEIYRKIGQETFTFNPMLFLGIEVDTSNIKDYRDSERYEQLSARYVYTWGAQAKVPVMFDSVNPIFLNQFQTFDQYLYTECCESASIEINDLSAETEIANMRSQLLCSDFTDLFLLVRIGNYEANLTRKVINSMEKYCKPSSSFFIQLTFPTQEDISFVLNFINEVAHARHQYSGEFKGVFIVLNATHCGPYKSLMKGIKRDGMFPQDKIFIYGSICGESTVKNFRKPILVSLIKPGYKSVLGIELIGDALSNAHELTRKHLPDHATKIAPFAYQDFLLNRDVTYFNKGCYGFKIFWNSLRQWASLFRYRLVSQITLSTIQQNVKEIYWFKKEGHYSLLKTVTNQSTKFLSNYQEECVILEVPPRKYFNWTMPNMAGVTLNLGENIWISPNSEDVASLLQLIHTKFTRVELSLNIPMQFANDWDFSTLQAITSIGKSNRIDFNKYYINLGRVGPDQYKKFVAGVEPIFNVDKGRVGGIHFEFSSEYENLEDYTNLMKLSKTFSNNVGVLLKYTCGEDWKTPDDLVLIHANYVVLNLRVAGLLATYGTPITSSKRIKNYKFDILDVDDMDGTNATCWVDFDQVFIQIRLFKLKCHEVNPNVEVILKLQILPQQKEEARLGFIATQDFVSISKFIDEFSSTFHFPFFFNNAFDSNDNLSIGWWRAKDETKFGDPKNYVEKISEFYYPLKDETEIKILRKYEPTESKFLFKILIASVVSLVQITIGIASVFFYLRKKAKLKRENEIHELWNRSYGFEIENSEQYELHKDDFNPNGCTRIGAGKFGIVYKTYMSRFRMEVAVKVPQTSQFKTESDMALKSMFWEIRIMSYVGEHKHILKLLGAYTKDIGSGNIFLVTELCEHGSLVDHLKELNEPKEDDDFIYEFYRYCEEISSGMEYLAEKNVIHGDLSARNVLLGTHKVCKISDFGLSRKLDHYEKYIKESSGPLPWAWMAIESLQRLEFTLKSDVWSMGITFWEIFNFGRTPYAGLCFNENFKGMLADGMRLDKPESVSEQVYAEVMKCWSDEPNLRPTPTYFVQYFRGRRSFGYECIEEINDDDDSLMETKL